MTPTFTGQKELRSHGVDAANASNHARGQAVLHGIRMTALCGNIWPAEDDGLFQLVAQDILGELTFFAIQARRFMELAESKNLRANDPLIRIKSGEFRYEASVWTTVNRIIHADELKVISVTADTKKHDNLGDLIVAHVHVSSPQRDSIAVCPQGLFFGFLQSAIAEPVTTTKR